jgi:hypothetical protein
LRLCALSVFAFERKDAEPAIVLEIFARREELQRLYYEVGEQSTKSQLPSTRQIPTSNTRMIQTTVGGSTASRLV